MYLHMYASSCISKERDNASGNRQLGGRFIRKHWSCFFGANIYGDPERLQIRRCDLQTSSIRDLIRRALPRACQITSLAIWNMKQPSSKCQRCSAILFVSCNNFRRFRIQIMFFHNKFEQCFNSCSNNCFLFEKCAREGVCQGAPGHWNRVLFESVWATFFQAFFGNAFFHPSMTLWTNIVSKMEPKWSLAGPNFQKNMKM